MRLAYLTAPVLGLLLVGCGPDEEPEQIPRPTIEQPSTGTPELEEGASTRGTKLGEEPIAGPASDPEPVGAMDNAPADNGSGLGTASGAGTAPNPTPGASGASQ